MRISVAMCTYNGERYLDEQLQSIARQTLQPYELVVCDDGSSDSTVPILENFARSVAFNVRLHKNEKNLGYTKNFESAIRLCDGELIALSDQDDIWHPDKLKRLHVLFEENINAGGIFTNGELIDCKSLTTGQDLWENFKFDRNEQKRFECGKSLDVLLRRNVVTGMTLVFRAKLRNTVLPIPVTWEHDAWVAIMIALYSNLDFCTVKLVKYRIHDDQQLGVPLSFSKKLHQIALYGFRRFLVQSKLRNIGDYERMKNKFDDLIARLRSTDQTISADQLSRISGKAEHCHAALTALSKSRLGRLPNVLSQAYNYKNYSITGLRTMFRDLVI